MARFLSRLRNRKRVSIQPPAAVTAIEAVDALARSSSEAIERLQRRVIELEGRTALHCSFCGKSQYEVPQLISAGNVSTACICNECLTLSVGLLTEKNHAASR